MPPCLFLTAAREVSPVIVGTEPHRRSQPKMQGWDVVELEWNSSWPDSAPQDFNQSVLCIAQADGSYTLHLGERGGFQGREGITSLHLGPELGAQARYLADPYSVHSPGLSSFSLRLLPASSPHTGGGAAPGKGGAPSKLRCCRTAAVTQPRPAFGRGYTTPRFTHLNPVR